MKTRLLLALSAFVAFLTTSCNINENITISEDGSGTMYIEMDGSQMMALAGSEMGADKKVDSTFAFKDLFKGKEDSIAKLPKADQERLNMLKNVTGHMLMDPENGEFTMKFNNNFKKASDLGNMMSTFEAMRKLNAKEGQPDVGLDSKTPAITYAYDGKKFKKTVAPKEKKEEEELGENMEMVKQMFEGSTYTVNYTFPKKVKSVSNKNAVISTDKKTVKVVYDLLDYMDTPKDLDLEVVFE